MRPSHFGSCLWCILLACLYLSLPTITSAETKTLTAEGTYTMGDGETPLVAELRALQQAKRMAVEQAGTYVQSYSKTKHYELTSDEIETVSAGLIEVEVVDKRRQVVGEGIQFYVKIKASVTVEKADELVSRLRQKSPDDSPNLVSEYKKLKDDYTRLATDMDTLKRQMAESKDEQGQRLTISQIAEQIAEQERKYKARESYGWCLASATSDYNSAVACLDDVIRLDPSFADAWGVRGSYRQALSQYEGSLSDYTEAIRLDPQPDRYHERGVVFEMLNKPDRALMDADEAIRLDDHAGNLYQWRGVLNLETGHYSEALSDYTNAIRLNSDTYKNDPLLATRALVGLYGDRGLTYSRSGQYQKAIADFTKELELLDSLQKDVDGSPEAQTTDLFGLKWRKTRGLLNRGKAYGLLKRNDEAMRDYKRACALGDLAHALEDKLYMPVISKEACGLLKSR